MLTFLQTRVERCKEIISTSVRSKKLLRKGEHYVCKYCRKIDFRSLLWHEYPPGEISTPNLSIDNSDLTNINDLDEFCKTLHGHPKYDKDCAVCTLLHETPNGAIQRRIDATPVFSSFLADNDIPGVKESVALVNYTDKKIFGVPTGGELKSLVNERWDATMAHSWLRTCLQAHGPTYNQRLHEVKDIALIDCEHMAIVQGDASSRWIALSYVWGDRYQSPTSPTLRPGSQLPEHIPRTIEDAITVTKELGYRYLWVDEYCIDQHVEHRRNLQIGHMDEIYRHADLTIVAAAGDDKTYGLPRVGKTKRKRIKAVPLSGITLFANLGEPEYSLKSIKWFTRAWSVYVFQFES
jgi:hypothetical protein